MECCIESIALCSAIFLHNNIIWTDFPSVRTREFSTIPLESNVRMLCSSIIKRNLVFEFLSFDEEMIFGRLREKVI